MKRTNSIISYYKAILEFLRAKEKTNEAIEEIWAIAKKASPSWAGSLRYLDECTNRSENIADTKELSRTLNGFVKAAFRDLSVLKDPQAMRVFHSLANKTCETFTPDGDLLIWARNEKIRKDGSAVIILHVSNSRRFHELLEKDERICKTSEIETSLKEVLFVGL